jgi:hypothetical protein
METMKKLQNVFEVEPKRLQRIVILKQFIQDILPFSTCYKFSFHKVKTKHPADER